MGFVGGQVRTDRAEKVWSTAGEIPTPEQIVGALRNRGLAVRIAWTQSSRKSGRRFRAFEVQPFSGGPGCTVTVKKRFWDSYDLLAVPDVYEILCRRYHMKPQQLQGMLRNAKFGIEVRSSGSKFECEMTAHEMGDRSSGSKFGLASSPPVQAKCRAEMRGRNSPLASSPQD